MTALQELEEEEDSLIATVNANYKNIPGLGMRYFS